MKPVVGEIPALVTGGAARLAVEQREAALGIVGNRALIALDPRVERSGAGHDRAFEGRECLGDIIAGHALAGENCAEPFLIIRYLIEPLHQFAERHVHFIVGLDRSLRLFFQ